MLINDGFAHHHPVPSPAVPFAGAYKMTEIWTWTLSVTFLSDVEKEGTFAFIERSEVQHLKTHFYFNLYGQYY